MLNEKKKMELEQELDGLQEICNQFYVKAQYTGVHAFIEFCGLTNEFMKICQQTLDEEIDFNDCNIHLGKPMKVYDFNLEYIAEKFSCIFGSSLREDKLNLFYSLMKSKLDYKINKQKQISKPIDSNEEKDKINFNRLILSLTWIGQERGFDGIEFGTEVDADIKDGL